MFDMCCQKMNYITSAYGIPTYALVYEQELIDIANKYPHVTLIERDAATAFAEGPLQFIYKDVLNVSNEDYLMFLNPCLTFLTPETIVNAIHTFEASGKNYGTSVKEFKNWLWNDTQEPVNYIDYKRLTTKEITPWYQAAHCFHVFNREDFQRDGYMLKEDDIELLLVPEEETIDIDTQEEYEFAKWKWEH